MKIARYTSPSYFPIKIGTGSLKGEKKVEAKEQKVFLRK
jgi:hypothetical protein